MRKLFHLRHVKRSAMPSPVEFWLCTSDFNPLNFLISQPISKDRCEVIPRDVSDSTNQNTDSGPQIQHFFG